MAKSMLHKFGAGFAAVTLAASMVPMAAGSAFAADAVSPYWSAPTSAVNIDYSSVLKTYGVRAGSAGPDFLGISNTNFDMGGSPSKYANAQNTGYTADGYMTGNNSAALAIWATSVNENPNPFYANLAYTSATGNATTGTATTWICNPESSSWGDSEGNTVTTLDGSNISTISGLEYQPEIIFGANKSTSWGNLDYTDTNIYSAVVAEQKAGVDYNPTFTNNDSTNMWTQIYSINQLAATAESLTAVTDKTTRYGDATQGALAYEKSIRGNMLYVASQIDSGKQAKKTVAYLYAIMDGTGYFFVPTAEGLTNGKDTAEGAEAETASTTAATAGTGYAGNNGTINLDYMGALPFISDTFDSGTEVEGGIVMKVEDIFKSNPACTVSSSNGASALADVDVIIYNTNTQTDTLGNGTSNGMNKSGINNDVVLTDEVVSDWAKAYGFKGDLLAGDDWGCSNKQGLGKTAATANGMSPALYCARNYTTDKNARTAWAFSKVYPELYANEDASYSYWLSNVYHVKTDLVGTVNAYMTNQSDTVIYNNAVEADMEANFAIGYDWWMTTGSKSETWSDFAYYNGSTRASYYDGEEASEEPVDTIGIFQPSNLWIAENTSDVDTSAWYGQGVKFVANKGLMTGYEDGTFGVNHTMTRAELAVVLWRYYEPEAAAAYQGKAENTTGMTDVEDNAYYTAAANWAVENGVINGFLNEDGTRSFNPWGDAEFEQVVAILLNGAGADYEDYSTAGLSKFTDAADVHDWAQHAMAYAANIGLVHGNADGTLAPQQAVARERAAVVLMNAFGSSLLS